jgi:hypothetical protein
MIGKAGRMWFCMYRGKCPFKRGRGTKVCTWPHTCSQKSMWPEEGPPAPILEYRPGGRTA